MAKRLTAKRPKDALTRQIRRMEDCARGYVQDMHLLRLRRDQDDVQRRMKDDVFDVFVDRQTAVLAGEPRFALPGGIGHLRSSKPYGGRGD